jgi:hypothetical protein
MQISRSPNQRTISGGMNFSTPGRFPLKFRGFKEISTFWGKTRMVDGYIDGSLTSKQICFSQQKQVI